MSRGNWTQTFTGGRFYPADPRPSEVDPRDIAHALSLTCRFGGHVRRFYSVAEHCVLMSHAVRPESALWALLHDAAEAYVGDMVRPLKRMLPQYELIENEVLAAITLRFGVRTADQAMVMPAEVKEADNRILITERRALLTPTSDEWETDTLEALPVAVSGWSPAMAEELYLRRLFDLVDADVMVGGGAR